MKYEELKQIIKDMEESKLESLEIEFPDGTKISMTNGHAGVGANGIRHQEHIDKDNQGVYHTPLQNEQTKETPEVVLPKEDTEDLKIIKSPMVGTFYASSTPDKPPYVKVGDIVKKGDTLCIIEAMKLMNEIESEFDGEIVEICVKNENMVEYGMPIFKIK